MRLLAWAGRVLLSVARWVSEGLVLIMREERLLVVVFVLRQLEGR